MSGHSKWSSIKRQKGVTDAKRGQLFTKLTREIIVAVREGGSNPEGNFRLRLAIQKARDNNMPLENIERAVKRGSGELEGVTLSELTFEGYGPGGAAVLVQALTDNRNRTLQEVRNIFSRGGGSLGENGCVAWLFESRGLITVEAGEQDPEELALAAIDTGAEDVKVADDCIEIYTSPEELVAVRGALEQKEMDRAEQLVRTALRLNPKRALSHNVLGRIWLNRSHWQRSIRHFEKACRLDGDNKYYRNNLGFAWHKLGAS